MSIDPLAVLRASVDRLQGLVSSLDDVALEAQAYPSEWSIADVLSHIGSSAEIYSRRVDDTLAGRTTPDDFAPSVWDRWNAKTPREKADDGLAADRALLEQLGSVTDEQRSNAQFAMGPLTMDFAGYLGLRLNEHAVHTWDIAVALRPGATIAADAVEAIIDNLDLVARFTAKPTGSDKTITVRTRDPVRVFVLTLRPDAVSFASDDAGQPDLELSAEAFIRLVYGRLDPANTPPVTGDEDVLDELRRVYPGP